MHSGSAGTGKGAGCRAGCAVQAGSLRGLRFFPSTLCCVLIGAECFAQRSGIQAPSQ